MSDQICSLCAQFYEMYPPQADSSDPRKWHAVGSLKIAEVQCAFRTGKFSPDNWNCRTMNVLRELAEPTVKRDDLTTGSIGLVKIDEVLGFEERRGYLVMTWYKNRGSTDSARILRFSHEYDLSLLHVEAIVAILRENQPNLIRQVLHIQ